MLAHLDAQLDQGTIDQHSYEARKLKVQELIRKGDAYTFSPTEKAIWLASYGLMAILGLGVIGMVAANGGNFIGVGVGLFLLIFGLTRISKTLRH